MRRQIQSVPRKLPNVRLYLDDLEAIINILADELKVAVRKEKSELDERVSKARVAIRKLMPGPSAADAPETDPPEPERQVVEVEVPTAVTYQMGDVEMDSIDDLLYQGGSVKNLTVKVSNSVREYSYCSVEFRSWDGPELSLAGLNDDQRWRVYAQVLEICNRRRMFLKEFFSALPSWFTWLALTFIGPLLVLTANTEGLARTIFAVISVVATPIFVVGIVAALRPTRVYLVRSHERDKVATETRKKYRDLIITLILGGVVAELIRYFGGKLLK